MIHKEWDREILDAREYARKSMIVSINKDKELDETDEMSAAEDRVLYLYVLRFQSWILAVNQLIDTNNVMYSLF